MALAGDADKGESLAEDLARTFSQDSLVRDYYLPTVHAQAELNHNNPSKGIEALQATAPYELGSTGNDGNGDAALFPVYLSGKAYLAAHQGFKAVSEFQKIIDHRGVVLNAPIGALAHLQIGRAYAMAANAAKAKAAYQNFLGIWKDADPDIPILKEAKAEYAKLQ
jgi:hypothetical protein